MSWFLRFIRARILGWQQGGGRSSAAVPAQSPPPPTILTSSPLPAGMVGLAYSYSLVASGGIGQLNWSLTNAAPNTGSWITVTGAGSVLGTPGTAETESLTVTVVDAGGRAASAVLSLTVQPALAITTSSPLPQATQNSAYSTTLASTGGAGGYSYTLLSATPNTGNWLHMNAAGTISGTPGTAETETLTVQVQDSLGRTASKTFSLVVQAASQTLTITTTSPLPNATQNAPYSTALAATGGSGSGYQWVILSDTPDTGNWLSINLNTGVLSGTPGTAETETVTVKVTDSLNNTTQKTFTLTVQSVGGTLSVTTASLPGALVGHNYSAALAASGGTAPYSWTLVSCAPNTDLWLSVNGANLVGIPELFETEAITVQVTDTLGATASANLSLNVTVSGALGIVTPTGSPNYYSPAAPQGGLFALRMLAQGGQPPYYWAFSGPAFAVTGSSTGTQYAMDHFGWLTGGVATNASGTDTLTVICTDTNGATATQTVSVAASSTLQFYSRDPVSGGINLPDAYASTSYRYQFKASAGSGTGYTYTAVSGMPTGMSLSSSGLLTGASASSGSALITVQVKDSANNQTTGVAALNIRSQDKAARPAYNTGSGFFVDAGGNLRDGSGYRFLIRGLDRGHYDSSSWAGPANGGLAYPNTVRTLLFDVTTAANAVTHINTQCIPNNILTICMMGYYNAVGTSGHTDTAILQGCLTNWVSYFSTLSPIQSSIVVNVANEWGATNSTAWRDAYVYQTSAISNISGTTVTVSSAAGSNPFAACPFALIKGAGGIADQVVGITATGGSSGAWTATIGTSLAGYTSGGTFYGGAIGILRGIGYTCPILVDTGSSGEDPFDILNYSPAINNSDPQKNCIFALHPYQSAMPFQALIKSVTLGNPTTLTLESNWNVFPLWWTGSSVPPGNNNFNLNYQITGAQGLTTLNGIYPSDNKTYGAAGSWQVKLSVDSSAWTGTYVTDSATIVPANQSSGRNLDYRYVIGQLAALRSQGVCAGVMEFGPGNQSGNPTTPESGLNSQQAAPAQIISACEANGVPYLSWAWDDHNSNLNAFSGNWFNMVFGNNGVYSANNQFTAFGLDIVGNPRYGLWARSAPAASFLPAPPPQSQPLLRPQAFTYLGTFLAPSTGNGGNNFSLGGNSLSVSQDTKGGLYPDGQLYLTGNSPQGNSLGMISIPTRAQIQQGATGNFVTATMTIAPVTIPYTYTTGTLTQPHMGSTLVWNGRLIYQQFSSYSNIPTNTHGAIKLDLSDAATGQLVPGSNTVANMGPLTGTTQLTLRHVNQFMGVIPTEWRSLLGGPCLTGAAVESTLSTGGVTGVSAYVFDPANVPGEGVTGMNPIPMNCCLDYFFKDTTDAGWAYSLGGATPQIGWNACFLEPATISTLGVLSGTIPNGQSIKADPIFGSVIVSGGDSFQTAAGAPIGAIVTRLLSGTGLPGSPSTWQLSQSPASTVNGNVFVGNIDNGYCGQADRYCGIIFPSRTRTVAFVGRHGKGPQTYKNPNDNSGGNGAQPYALRMLMFDAAQFSSVLAGTAYPWGPTSGSPTVPYATLDLNTLVPAAAGLQTTLNGLANFSSCYYDESPLNGNPSRIYYVDSQATTHVHVFEVSH